MSYQTEEILGNIAVIAFGSAIGAVILEVIYFFGFFIFHDCGKWICSHEPDISWTSYGICFAICAVFLTICCLAAEGEKGSSKPRKTQRPKRKTMHYSSGLETNYYDSDMEGAPGYYGFD